MSPGPNAEPFHLADPPSPPSKFASLPLDSKHNHGWAQARQASAAQHHLSDKRRRAPSEDGLEDLRHSSEDGLDEEDEDEDDNEEAEDEREEDEDEEEERSNRPSPEKERASSAHNNHHHHHHHHHHQMGSRRPPRQSEIIKSSR